MLQFTAQYYLAVLLTYHLSNKKVSLYPVMSVSVLVNVLTFNGNFYTPLKTYNMFESTIMVQINIQCDYFHLFLESFNVEIIISAIVVIKNMYVQCMVVYTL